MWSLLTNKYVLIGLLVSTILTYFWYLSNKATNLEEELKQKEVLIEGAIEKVNQANQTVTVLQAQMIAQSELLNQQLKEMRKVEKDIESKKKVFEDHNLDNLAKKKPVLIENRVNRATERVFREIEDESTTFINSITN